MLSSKDLETVSSIKIDRWIDIESSEAKKIGNTAFTKRILKAGFQDPPFIFTDELGRIYGKNSNGTYWPLHDIVGGQKVGYRIAKKACN